MIDTNSIAQAAATVAAVKAQVTTNWPAICLAAAWCARELHQLNQWLVSVGEWVIARGGIKTIVCNLWNSKPKNG